MPEGLFDTFDDLLASAEDVMRQAEEAAEGRQIVKRLLMFSGGDDSTAVAHHFRRRADALVHINTGIGIPQTRQFVRDTATAWGLPLIEKSPPPGEGYRNLVMGTVRKRSNPAETIRYSGFPGPTAHGQMYQWLKHHQLDRIRQEIITDPRRQRLLLVTGLRRQESERRRARPPVDLDGSLIWASPMIYWSKMDLNEYRRRNPDCPRNEVAAHLHRSGECLCGAFMNPEDLDEIGFFYPEVAAEIRALEAEAAAAGIARCVWAEGSKRRDRPAAPGGPLCTSCNIQQGLW